MSATQKATSKNDLKHTTPAEAKEQSTEESSIYKLAY